MSCVHQRLMEHLPWAQRFARTCTAKLPAHLDHENLQSAGVLGYLHAASRYDLSRGSSFRAFCAVRIRGAILDELRRWDWAPRSVHKNQRRITNVTQILTEQLDRLPTCGELARALGVESSEIESYQAQIQNRQMLSFDEITGKQSGEGGVTLAERLPDPHVLPPDVTLLIAENRQLIHQCLRLLPKTEATILDLHYFQGFPLRDLAAVLAVSPSRISQLHHQALGRLRQTWRCIEKAGTTRSPCLL